jgi:hypothetical protein
MADSHDRQSTSTLAGPVRFHSKRWRPPPFGFDETIEVLCRIDLCQACMTVLTSENWHPFRYRNYQRICNDCYRVQSKNYRARKLGLTISEYDARLRQIAERRADRHCRKCGVLLDEANWDMHDQEINSRICRRCRNEYSKDWLARNPEKRRSYRLKLIFGITLDDAREIWERQGRRCWLCERPLSFEEANIDHDHERDKVRGLVHGACNAIAGLAQDDPSMLAAISESLRKRAGKEVD